MSIARNHEAIGSDSLEAEREPVADTGLSPEELEAESGAALPDREAMSLISANVDIPANPAIAADVLAGELDGFGESDGPEDVGR
jgi:hypothetical protein